MKDRVAEVRTSSFALLGDLAMCAFPSLAENLPMLMPEVINGMETLSTPSYASPSNNATWAAGEIALKYGNSG
jgi:transportin-1